MVKVGIDFSHTCTNCGGNLTYTDRHDGVSGFEYECDRCNEITYLMSHVYHGPTDNCDCRDRYKNKTKPPPY